MAKTTSLAEAKKRAREAVAQVKQRVARQHGSPDEAADESGAGADGTVSRHALNKAQAARAMGHPAARTQRTQGRREGN